MILESTRVAVEIEGALFLARDPRSAPAGQPLRGDFEDFSLLSRGHLGFPVTILHRLLEELPATREIEIP